MPARFDRPSHYPTAQATLWHTRRLPSATPRQSCPPTRRCMLARWDSCASSSNGPPKLALQGRAIAGLGKIVKLAIFARRNRRLPPYANRGRSTLCRFPEPAMPDSTRFDEFVLAKGEALRAADRPPASKAEWQTRRTALREAMFAAMGSFPETPCDLKPEVLGKIERETYRIERLVFQSRTDIWVTANLYLPKTKENAPAVLVVHGPWA